MGSYSKSPTTNGNGIYAVGNDYATSAAAYADVSTASGFATLQETNNVIVGQDINYNSLDGVWSAWCYQAFVEFETPETGTVTAATLKIWLSADFSTTDFNIEVFAYDFGATATTADFRTPTQLSGLTSVGSISTSGIGATGALKSITLNTSAINRSGPTRLLLASAEHRIASEPTNSENVALGTLDLWVLEYTTTGNDLAATSRNRIGVVTKAQPSVVNDLTVSSVVEIGAVTRSTAQPAPSVSSVAEVGAITRSTITNDLTASSGIQVGAVTRSTAQPAPSVSSRTQVGITTRSQPSNTVTVSALVEVGAVLKVSGELVVSVPGTAVATFAAPTATATFAAPTATATITAPTATMTFSKEP